MSNSKEIIKIVITGPESTGKTTLAKMLSKNFISKYVPEYARQYVENLNNKYAYNDVIKIAEHQIKQFETNYKPEKNTFIFFDTGLIITKIWFKEVFNKIPEFLTEYLKNLQIDMHLVCYPDIPWVADNVRENGGEKRYDLYHKYIKELEYYNFRYKTIKGTKESRYQSAKKYISSAYCLHNNHLRN